MSYRFRMYPTVAQAETLGMHCAHARYVWNLALGQQEMAPTFRRYPDQASWDRQLAEARKASGWLGKGSSSVQQAALRDLRQAFRNWWSNPGHFRTVVPFGEARQHRVRRTRCRLAAAQP